MFCHFCTSEIQWYEEYFFYSKLYFKTVGIHLIRIFPLNGENEIYMNQY